MFADKIQPLPSEILDLKKHINQNITKVNLANLNSYINEFIKYLENDFKVKYGKSKLYDNDFIAGQIFKIQIKNNEFKTYYKYKYFALIEALKRIFTAFTSNSKRSPNNLKSRIPFIKNVIFETIQFLDVINQIFDSKSHSYGHFQRNIITSLELFNASKMLLHNEIILGVIGDFAIRPSSVSLIRQALELRIIQALGINSITNKEGKIVKITGTIFSDFIKQAGVNIIFPVSTSSLLHIYRWCSYFIHTGHAPDIYEIDWAIHILEPLFLPDKNGKTFSRYGAIKIKKNYYNKIEENLKTYLSDTLDIDEDDILVNINKNPDCLLI